MHRSIPLTAFSALFVAAAYGESVRLNIGTLEPATWVNYLIVTYPTIQILPLWSVPLPAIDPPLEIPISFPFPAMGWVGIWTGLFAPDGSQSIELAWVATGW